VQSIDSDFQWRIDDGIARPNQWIGHAGLLLMSKQMERLANKRIVINFLPARRE
jgi:hypothetical protein